MANLSTSYDVESGVKTTLRGTISPTAVTGIQLNYALAMTSGVLRLDPDTTREEFISFGGTVIAGGITTLTDVVRNLSKTANNFSGTGTGSQHSGGACIVEVTNYHALYNLKANLDRANIFSANQTISGTNKIYFNNANNWIYSDGTDLFLRAANQSQVSLATLAAAAGTDEKTKVSITDTTIGYLNSKMAAGNGISLTIANPGGNEALTPAVDLAADPGLTFSGGKLLVKIKPTSGITLDSNGLSFDTTFVVTSAQKLVASHTFGESISIKNSLGINGDEKLYQADSSSLNDTFTFIGTANEAGNADETKQVNFAGTVIDISGQTPTSGRLWTGVSQTSSNTSAAVYGTNWEGQTYTVPAGQKRIDELDLHLTKVGNGGNGVAYSCIIYATDVNGLPTGAALATRTLAQAAMASGLNRFTGFNLTVTPGTKYAIVLKNASADVSNNYTWSYNNTSVLANANRTTSSDGGATWTAQATHDFRFTVYYNAVAGSDLYLTNTPGVMNLAPGTYFQRTARAISDTQAVLMPGSPFILATLTWTASASTVNTIISLGFRPKAVICNAKIGAWGSQGSYAYGSAQDCFGTTMNMSNTTVGSNGTTGIAIGYTDKTLTNGEYLTVAGVGADTITIQRTPVNSGADGTAYLLIFG